MADAQKIQKLIDTLDEYIAQAKAGMNKNFQQIEEMRADLVKRGFAEALDEIEGVIEITGHHGQALGRLTMAGMIRQELLKLLEETK
jgi:methyl-accepting chemotaxis protein